MFVEDIHQHKYSLPCYFDSLLLLIHDSSFMGTIGGISLSTMITYQLFCPRRISKFFIKKESYPLKYFRACWYIKRLNYEYVLSLKYIRECVDLNKVISNETKSLIQDRICLATIQLCLLIFHKSIL